MKVKPALSMAGGVAISALALRAVACAPFGAAASDDAGAAARAGSGPEAAADLASGITGFCASHDASFCADFDEDLDAAAGWSGTALDPSGVISETTTSVSSPRAFSSRTGADGGQARLSWRFPSTAHRTTFTFDIKLVRSATLSVGEGLAIAELDCVNATDAGLQDWGGVWLAGGTVDGTNAPNLQLTAGGKTYPLPNLPADWSNVVIAVDWGPPMTHIKVTAGPATLLDVDNAETCDQKSDAFVLLGVASDFPGEAIFDNVLVDVEP
jgi:hypothetical protein